MKIKAVIFDFDGTIADTRGVIVAAKQETMRRMHLKVYGEEACAATIGLTAKSGFLQMYPDLEEPVIDACVDLYRQLFESLKKEIPPVLFEVVRETLSQLEKRGIQKTIASSRNNKSLQDFLSDWNMEETFPYVLGGGSTQLQKPNPDPVLKTLADLSLRADEVLVVGDMPFDIEMGKRAGVYTCGVTYGNATRKELISAGADFVIDRMEELLDLL